MRPTEVSAENSSQEAALDLFKWSILRWSPKHIIKITLAWKGASQFRSKISQSEIRGKLQEIHNPLKLHANFCVPMNIRTFLERGFIAFNLLTCSKQLTDRISICEPSSRPKKLTVLQCKICSSYKLILKACHVSHTLTEVQHFRTNRWVISFCFKLPWEQCIRF